MNGWLSITCQFVVSILVCSKNKVHYYILFAEYALFPPQLFVMIACVQRTVRIIKKYAVSKDRQPSTVVDRPPQRNVGVFSGGAPPLPFPNRVVKPASADGTWTDVPGE